MCVAGLIKRLVGFLMIIILFSCQSQGGKQPETPISSSESGLTPAPEPFRSTKRTSSLDPIVYRQEAASESPKPILTEQALPVIQAVYVPMRIFNSSQWSTIERALNDKRLNAVVLDIKGDSGQALLPMDNPMVEGIETAPSQNLLNQVKRLKHKGIYIIARIVAFKDPFFVSNHPEIAIHTKKGRIWHDPKGITWIDPFVRKGWDYSLALAQAAAIQGFDEVQFDYVRFPDNAARTDREAAYHSSEFATKSDAIAGFLGAAKQMLKPYGVYLSADVFGMTTSSNDDMGIGQAWNKITKQVDFICPMVYPSHYGKGVYGVRHPDLQPYRIVQKAMQDAISKNADIPGHAAIRPWLQDFTARWVNPHLEYGPQEVGEQIKALREVGIDQYMLWSPSAQYHLPNGDLP